MDLAILVVAATVIFNLLSPSQAVSGDPFLKVLFVSRTALLLLLCTWLLRQGNRSWAGVGLRRPNWWRLVLLVPLGLLLVMTALALVKAALAHFSVRHADYAAFAPLRGNLAEYLFWLLPVTVGCAAFGEEMIFRGFILDTIQLLAGGAGRWATLFAIVGQAALFGLLHSYQGLGGIVTTAVTGLIFGIIWWRADRNIWPGILIHALLDGTAMTLIFLGMKVT